MQKILILFHLYVLMSLYQSMPSTCDRFPNLNNRQLKRLIPRSTGQNDISFTRIVFIISRKNILNESNFINIGDEEAKFNNYLINF